MAVVAGEGTVVAVGASASTTAVVQVNSISYGPIEQAGVDDHSLDSDYKTQRPSGLPDLGSLSVSMYYDPDNATHQLIYASSHDESTVYFGIGFTSDGTGAESVTGSGFITSFEFSGMEVDGNLTADWELKVNALDE